MGKWITKLGVMGAVVVHLIAPVRASTTYSAQPILSCDDFYPIFEFIHENHLRFTQMSTLDRESLLWAARNQMASSLIQMGYPLLAAQWTREILPKWVKVKPSTLETFCDQLGNTIFRAAFLKSFARQLDPYSDFYTSEELQTRTSVVDGEFVGVGIATQVEDDFLRVTEVVPGGPSDGRLKASDIITSIDGHTVTTLSELEVRSRIRGERGTLVVFSIVRDSKNLDVTIKRDIVHQKSVTHRWADKVLTIRLHRFYRQSPLEVESLLKKYASEMKGVILDLRDNPGGLLQAARDIVDLFISDGVVVYLKGRAIEDQIWATQMGGYLTTPLVVLINDGTASAAEIVAGSLQDYGRAILVGQSTYGKGSVQNIYDTSEMKDIHYPGGLKLTTLWYYLPSGRSVKQLEPDVRLPARQNPIRPPAMPFRGPDLMDPRDSSRLASHMTKEKMRALEVNRTGTPEDVGLEVLKRMLAESINP